MSSLVFLVGVTGSGKSALALRLAREFSAHILNCDSIQQYQGFDIGSAKPSLAERNSLPHHLFDWVPLGQQVSVGDFLRASQKVFADHAGQLMLCVGGTGFYFQALEHGLFPVPPKDPKVQEALMQELTELGSGVLHERLQALDPAAALRIHPEDHYRLIRALEIIQTTGTKVSELEARTKKQHQLPGPVLKLGVQISKEDLEVRLRERIQRMLDAGWIEEVETLLQKLGEDFPVLRSVGYLQIVQHLRGVISVTELSDEIFRAHWRLAKKQRTWFRRDSEIRWLMDTDDFVKTLQAWRRK